MSVSNIEELAALIKMGSVKNVAEFGGNKLGLPLPYCVIVPGPAAPDRQAYQIWRLHRKGAQLVATQLNAGNTDLWNKSVLP